MHFPLDDTVRVVHLLEPDREVTGSSDPARSLASATGPPSWRTWARDSTSSSRAPTTA